MRYSSISFCFASLMLMLAACHSIGDLNTEGRKRVDPIKIVSQVNQPSLADPSSVNSVPYIMYESVSCESDWDQYCDSQNTIKLEAPANWQACKPIYSVGPQGGDRGFDVWATSWYPGDTQRPSRFRAYIVRLWSMGSGLPKDPKDKWGSNIQLRDVGLLIIPADADNAARIKAGCEMRYDFLKSMTE